MDFLKFRGVGWISCHQCHSSTIIQQGRTSISIETTSETRISRRGRRGIRRRREGGCFRERAITHFRQIQQYKPRQIPSTAPTKRDNLQFQAKGPTSPPNKKILIKWIIFPRRWRLTCHQSSQVSAQSRSDSQP